MATASPGTGTGPWTDPLRRSSARTHDPTARPYGTGGSRQRAGVGYRIGGRGDAVGATARTWGGPGPDPLLAAPIAPPPGPAPLIAALHNLAPPRPAPTPPAALGLRAVPTPHPHRAAATDSEPPPIPAPGRSWGCSHPSPPPASFGATSKLRG